ncbi:CopG family ribbon-helix-helix protein [Jannaschia formosa]|uniref:CopG family ribbon-helix-helix protein n=1 Tax=Jannaschia formosa TaxID=2259592 RepID=UPI000E1C2CA3|nr:ribbon-helix-helix domain-containing protein [Jannaschia formosa]TFL16198.1 ribbon-helix-helix protein, CopG family [Jannaschia formosa]
MPAIPPVAVKLDPDIRARLRSLAAARDRSAHWLMREAIAQYVEREEQRESYRQDALEAWEAYQADGMDVTAEEADAWLTRLEAGEDAEPPVPHR